MKIQEHKTDKLVVTKIPNNGYKSIAKIVIDQVDTALEYINNKQYVEASIILNNLNHYLENKNKK